MDACRTRSNYDDVLQSASLHKSLDPQSSHGLAALLWPGRPIIVYAGIIESDSSLILGVIGPVRCINNHPGVRTDDSITVADTGWNPQFPRALRSNKNRVQPP